MHVLFALVVVAVVAPAAANDLVYPLSVVAGNDGAFVADRKLPGVVRISEGATSVHHQGAKRYRQPMNAVRCIAIDAKGRLLVGDSATREVYRFEKDGPKPLTNGAIGIPNDLAVDSEGRILVADLEAHRIWRIPAAGGKPEEFAVIRAPRGLAFDGDGRLWVVTHGENQLVRYDADGKPTVVLEGRPFRFPNDVVVRKDGTAYVSDGYAHAIWRVPAGESKPVKWSDGAPLIGPVGLALDDDTILVADPRAKAVFSLDDEGKPTPLVAPE